MTVHAVDPFLAETQAIVKKFKEGDDTAFVVLTAEVALAAVWANMNAATRAGWPSGPYVKLTDEITFPDEKRSVDPDKERAAAEWMAELAQREPEND